MHTHRPPLPTPDAEPPFKLSPPEPHPLVREVILPPAAEPRPASTAWDLTTPYSPRRLPIPAAQQPHANEPHVHFELLDDDADPASVVPVSPEITRGLQEIAEFEKDRRGYKIDG